MNFAPRVGIAWDVTGDGRTSVRSSYGKAYDFVDGQFLINTTVAPPWGAEIIIPTPAGKFENPWLGVRRAISSRSRKIPGRAAPFPSAGSFLPVQPDLKTTQIHSWNATVQRQIGNDIAVSAGYIGSYTSHLWNVRAINPGVYLPPGDLHASGRPHLYTVLDNTNLNSRRLLSMQNWRDGQLLGPLDLYDDQGHQTYNGDAADVPAPQRQRPQHQRQLHVVEVHGPSDAGWRHAERNSGYADPNNIDYDYGPCNADRRHIFNLTAVAATPDSRGRDRARLSRDGGFRQLPRGLWRAAADSCDGRSRANRV